MENTTMGLDWSGLIGLLIIAGIFGFGGGFGVGGNAGTALGLADIQASLYNQTQDANSRATQASISQVGDMVLTSKYDNALMMKEASQQLSNSIAGIGNLITEQTQTILGVMNQRTIDELRDKLNVTRDELSNTRQTAQITENILSNIAITAPKPPCYYGCCKCNQVVSA